MGFYLFTTANIREVVPVYMSISRAHLGSADCQGLLFSETTFGQRGV